MHKFRARFAALAALFFLSALAVAQQAIPEATLESLKASTVFVKVKENGELSGTGSGFFLMREADSGFVVTNAHVVTEDGQVSDDVSVVLRSGSKGESVLKAAVVATDDSRDLAILKVKGANLPSPLRLSDTGSIRETLPIYIIGFPFGESLSAGSGNPAPTIGKGSISSIRKDDYGRIERFQIDGDMNPGNSGGPIVTEQGILVGVSVAKLMGTGIGFAIPPREIEEMLLGRVREIGIKEDSRKGNVVTMGVELALIDPLAKIRNTSVVVIPKTRIQGTPKANAQGAWGPVDAAAKEYPLVLKDGVAKGTMTLQSNEKLNIVYVFQTKFTRGDGKTFYTEPAEFAVDFGRDAPADEGGKPGVATGPGGAASGGGGGWIGGSGGGGAVTGPGGGGASEIGKPVVTGIDLVKERKDVDDLKVGMVNFPGGALVPTGVFSSDGKYLYVVEKAGGVVHKIGVPSFIE